MAYDVPILNVLLHYMDKHLPKKAKIDIDNIGKNRKNNDLCKISRWTLTFTSVLTMNLLDIYELNIYLISFFVYQYSRNDKPECFLKFFDIE